MSEGFSAEFVAEFEAECQPKPPPQSKRAHPVDPDPNEGSKMGVSVSTYPPLGQVTQLSGGQIVFYALLQVAEDTPVDWEVALWHTAPDCDGTSAEWKETVLAPWTAGDIGVSGDTIGPGLAASDPLPFSLQSIDTVLARRYYRTAIAATTGPLHFTVKFRERRPGGRGNWRWIQSEKYVGDGTVVFNARTPQASWAGGRAAVAETPSTVKQSSDALKYNESLADLVKDLNSEFTVTSPMSQCPGTQLWQMQAAVPGVKDDGEDVSCVSDLTVGLPWGNFLRWFALARIWTPWLAPRHGTTKLNLDKQAVMCAFLNPAGRHLVFLAVSGVDYLQSVFQSDDAGRLVLHVRSDSLKEEKATVLVAVGEDFESANAAVMYHARSLVRQMSSSPENVATEAKTLEDGMEAQWLESWYDGLGYCTWNGLGQNLSEDRILHALATLAEKGIDISSLIIDDNWQSLDRKNCDGQFQFRWAEFEADRTQFPNGLGPMVAQVRARYPHIQHVAVWHALQGYWGGISPTGPLAAKYKTMVVYREHPARRHLPIQGPVTVVAAEDVQRFYNDFYSFLVRCGIDGVKTDGQFMMDTWKAASARRELITRYQDAWTIAILRHFSNRAISCMSQTPDILFYSQLPQNRPALLVRNSDDFFPEIPSSHPWHVWTNAHNSLLTQHLNIVPDWDMFQTVHDYSAFHAAARCVSGGPIYITDVPGEHDLDLIAQMTGRTLLGKTVIFRPSVMGRSLDHYVNYHDRVLLKVGSYHGNSDTGTGILGVFNVSDGPLTELLPISRIPGVAAALGRRFVVRAHSTGRLTEAVAGGGRGSADDDGALLTVSLDVHGYEIFSAYRLTEVTLSDAGVGPLLVANLGLVDKMAAAASVVRTLYQTQLHRVDIEIAVKALGTIGLYLSALPSSLLLPVADHFLVTMRGLAIPPHCVAVAPQDAHVLLIDAERAWKVMGLKPAYSNEVQIMVYVTV